MKINDIFGVMPARRLRMGDAPPSDVVACPIPGAPGLYQLRHGVAPYDYVTANAVTDAQLPGFSATPVAAGDPRCPVDATPAPYLCPTTPGMSAMVDLKTGTKLTADAPGSAIDNPGCPGYAARQAPPPPPPPSGVPVIVIQPPFGFGQPGYPGYPPGYYPPGYPPIGQYPPAPAPAAPPAAAATPEPSVDTVALVSGVGALGLIAAIAAGVFGK